MASFHVIICVRFADQPSKANQDAVSVHNAVAEDVERLFFAVYDGHGLDGSECAQFAKTKVRASKGCRSPSREGMRASSLSNFLVLWLQVVASVHGSVRACTLLCPVTCSP